MRIRPIAVCLFLVSFTFVNSTSAARFCRTCSQILTSSDDGSRTPEIAPPPRVDDAAPLAISSSGLEAEIQKRISDWADQGITPGAPTDAAPAAATQTVTIQVGGQTIEITVAVKGTGGSTPTPTGDLAKDLQTAFSADTVLPKTDKARIKDNLAKAFAELAGKFKSNDEIKLGALVVADKEDVGFLVRATLRNAAGAGNLPKTQAVILRRLEPLMPRNDRTALTAQIRAQLAAAFGDIAAALDALK